MKKKQNVIVHFTLHLNLQLIKSAFGTLMALLTIRTFLIDFVYEIIRNWQLYKNIILDPDIWKWQMFCWYVCYWVKSRQSDNDNHLHFYLHDYLHVQQHRHISVFTLTIGRGMKMVISIFNKTTAVVETINTFIYYVY